MFKPRITFKPVNGKTTAVTPPTPTTWAPFLWKYCRGCRVDDGCVPLFRCLVYSSGPSGLFFSFSYIFKKFFLFLLSFGCGGGFLIILKKKKDPERNL